MNRLAASFPALLALAVALGSSMFVGCGESSSAPKLSIAGGGQTPRERLDDLAKRYRDAKSYQDAGELRFLVDGAPEEEFRSLPFSVAFERPNRVRIHALDTTSVADGKRLTSIVQSLPGQVLVRDCPEQLTLEALSSDEMLRDAMRGQLQVEMPQLQLLTSAEGLATLSRDSTPTQLSDSEFLGSKCWRIALDGPAGRGVIWIDQPSGLLVKYEFPLEEIRKRFPLAKLWAEFRGAKIGDLINPVAFQTELPDDVKLVSKLIMPPPNEPHPMLGKPVENYTFLALDGTALGNQSLAGKVVVLDMWATWCGWCFEGLPLLNKVYGKYEANDQVAFLAVSKDDSTVTNAAVEEAFEKHDLKLPIVRDHEQVTDRVFQVEGLPTTIVIGRDGTVQDYHVGYDPNLADTLPAKLEKLLAGENLAKAELEAYEQQKQEFEARLSEVLVEQEPPATDSAAAPTSAPTEAAEVASEAGPSFE
jgi:thiol-disulfide isomerase/thioredoxin